MPTVCLCLVAMEFDSSVDSRWPSRASALELVAAHQEAIALLSLDIVMAAVTCLCASEALSSKTLGGGLSLPNLSPVSISHVA